MIWASPALSMPQRMAVSLASSSSKEKCWESIISTSLPRVVHHDFFQARNPVVLRIVPLVVLAFMIVEALHDFPRSDQEPAKDFPDREDQTQDRDQLRPDVEV